MCWKSSGSQEQTERVPEHSIACVLCCLVPVRPSSALHFSEDRLPPHAGLCPGNHHVLLDPGFLVPLVTLGTALSPSRTPRPV